MIEFRRGADGVQPGSDHKSFGISVYRNGEPIWLNAVEVHGSGILRELILARLESLPMAEKQRYLAQMKSQHVRMRVPWSPSYEEIGKAEALDAHADKKLEPISAALRPNLLQRLFGGKRTLA